MKKLAVLLFVQLFFSTVVLAQAQNVSFFGLKLGMTVSEVRSILSSQGKSRESIGDYYLVKDVKLGDCSFERLRLKFDNSKLVLGEFYNNFNRMGWNQAPNQDQATSMLQQYADKYKKIFNSMRMNLIDKYGSPRSDNGDEVVWRSGSSQIALYYTVYDGPHPDFVDSRKIETEVGLTYKRINTNVNY